MNDALLRLALILIAAITVVSGAVQMIAPGWVLSIITPAASGAEPHMFRTIGMFMVITGAMFGQSLITRTDAPAISFWIGMQKLAAAWLVVSGWMQGHFLWMALGVAGFDLASGVLALLFWRRIGR